MALAQGSPRTRSESAPGGFSILEMVIVLAVLVGLSALVAPAIIAPARRAGFEQAAQDVEKAAWRAREEARRLGVPMALEMVLESDGAWWLRIRSAADETEDGWSRGERAAGGAEDDDAIDGAPVGGGLAPANNETQAANGPELYMLARWTADGLGVIVDDITLTGPGGRVASLSVGQADGRARVIIDRAGGAPASSDASALPDDDGGFPDNPFEDDRAVDDWGFDGEGFDP